MKVEQTDRDAALVEELARAICEADSASWRTNEGRSKVAIEMCDHDALNNCWRFKARASLPIIHRERLAAEQRGREAERAEIVAWLRDQDGHGYDDMRADAIEARQHKVA